MVDLDLKETAMGLDGKGSITISYALQKVRDDERKAAWLFHGCGIMPLYGDDGEMQCGNCLIDFKRDSWKDIFSKIGRKNK